MLRPSTFSIVAYDPEKQEWGIAVQSKFLAAGAVVPWARAGAGAIATQSYANTRYGPLGLEMLAAGLSAQETLDALIAGDAGRDQRQVGLVDKSGRAAAFTGPKCYDWKGHLVGSNYCCQGNILAGEAVIKNMAAAFEKSSGDLADRLIVALEAAQAAGGDRRGKQSAGMLVVKEKGGYAGFNDRYVDLRVDDHPQPIQELKRLLDLYKLYFFKTDPHNLVRIEGAVAKEIQDMVARTGYYKGPLTGLYDAATKQAFMDMVHTENLEERWRDDDQVDRVVLDFLRERFKP